MAQESIKDHEDLQVYQMAFGAAMQIFELSKNFPVEERYSLTDRIRRSSRSVCANLAEAWIKRRYQAEFLAKLTACESEAVETQNWLRLAEKCDYLDAETVGEVYAEYNRIVSIIAIIIKNPYPWFLEIN